MRLKVNKGALIIGGGVAGMVASLELSTQGYEVFLVEKETDLGGNLRHIHYTLAGEKTDQFLNSLIEKALRADIFAEGVTNPDKRKKTLVGRVESLEMPMKILKWIGGAAVSGLAIIKLLDWLL